MKLHIEDDEVDLTYVQLNLSASMNTRELDALSQFLVEWGWEDEAGKVARWAEILDKREKAVEAHG
jgi:hypothetical protein